jgi:probable HAF family extracellular repeat protein
VIRDLGTLGQKDEQSEAVAINERGQIIGNRYIELPVSEMQTANFGGAFLWQSGKMRDLGTFSGPQRSWPPREPGTAVAINDRGQVVGWIYTKSAERAFLWDNGKMTNLGALPAGKSTYSMPVGINDRGDVAAVSAAQGGHEHAVVWKGGRLTDLGTLGGTYSRAAAINDRGEIVGTSSGKCGVKPNGRVKYCERPFLWNSGTMRELGTFGGNVWAEEPGAVAINNHGSIVGFSATRAFSPLGMSIIHAALWRNGKIVDLNSHSGKGESKAVAINERGDIVGIRGSALDEADTHAFLWSNDRITDLGTLIGRKNISVTNRSAPLAINNRGDIVGWSSKLTKRGESIDHAFVWRDGTMTDLGTLPGGKESWAVAINEHSQIVGWSTNGTGRRHAVLWTWKPAN